MQQKLAVTQTSETIFFDRIKGALRQRISLIVDSSAGDVTAAAVVRCAGERVVTNLDLKPGVADYICHAPVRWPRPAARAVIEIIVKNTATARSALTIGTHRPWTIYLLSDLCADDTWAYDDLDKHDRDDVATTLAELNAGRDNSYTFASAYQVERFMRSATAGQRRSLQQALKAGRIYATPTPDQLLCGGFTLSAYPLILEPYRRLVALLNGRDAGFCAYHMEATTWTNGTACLFADAGFSLFAKSLLRYQAPWLDALQTIPRLTRLEVSPGRFVYLLLRCGDYVEGMPLLEGLERANRLIHDEAIPSHERLAAAYPVSAIPFIGMYGDLAANSPDKHKAKMAIVKAYNSQGWEYPKLVNASWAHYGRSVRNELGDPARPKMRGLVTVRGDIGSSWEAWMMAAQVEHAAFRQSQRDVVSLRTLAALLKRRTKALDKQLSTAASEVAYLGDHAWNGSSDGSKALNLAVRQRRLGVTGDAVSSVRRHMLGGDELKPGMRVAVVNTLAWERECRVQLPQGVVLVDQQSGEQYADAVPAVPGLGARVFAVAAGSVRPQALIPGESPLALAGMRPLLYLDGQEAGVAGGWNDGMMGEWEAGPFRVTARIVSLEGAWELLLEVTGTPPQGPYELRFSFTLPWLQAVWRGESGGGFVTPGPSDKGGDSLLGIVGSVFAAGEGISAADPAGRERIDFVLGESGLAGLGGRTTARAIGTYGEKIAPQGIAVTMESTVTPGVLEWYLLGISQNYKEAFADQGGNRRWRYRCVMRRVSARFDDDELFRFAESQNRFAELVDPALLSVHTTALQVKGALVLGLSTRGRTVEVDLYNTSSRGKRVTLAGPLVRARRTRQADMLGRPQRGKGIFVGGKSFGKVVVDL